MKNWLEDKTVLHNILKQVDLTNTINGGTSETSVSIEKGGSNIEILASAAGVQSSDFRVNLNLNKLTISRFYFQEEDLFAENKWAAPVFIKQFNLPLNVDRDKIKAYYEDGILRISVPIKDETDLNKEIEIKEI